MSHAFMGLLTCARIESIELDREPSRLSFRQTYIDSLIYSWWGRRDADGWRDPLVDAPRRLPRLMLHRCLPHCVRLWYERQQNSHPSSRGFLPVDFMVGSEESLVSQRFIYEIASLKLSFFRTWALILGMSGLIVLFWFVGGGVALRYFVCYCFPWRFHLDDIGYKGPVYRCNVLHVCTLGCSRYVWSCRKMLIFQHVCRRYNYTQGQLVRCFTICKNLWMFSLSRYCSTFQLWGELTT